MCGIAGIVDFGRPVDPAETDLMAARLAHRGPDGQGACGSSVARLSHARLSVVDLSAAGDQPMQTRDGRFSLTYNGEVYNHRELRTELKQSGIEFAGHSDSEVVLQALALWGAPAIRRFEGMFALSLWDERTQSLFLARDRFGIKPMYYTHSGLRLAFGSELKALRGVSGFAGSLDSGALHEFLWFGNALGERTFNVATRRLLPGHTLRFSRAGLLTERFWGVEDPTPVHDDVETAATQVAQKLEEAVKAHLISDVPVGVFLSGGIDSSAITAFAARHYSGRLRTFSVGFDFSADANELPRAKRVAQLFDTDHTELHISGADIPKVIDALADAHDEPFGDAANIPLYLLCRQLRGDIKVVLQGDGGDEMFAGYRRYTILSHLRIARAAAYVGRGILSALRRNGHPRAARMIAALTERDPAARMALLLTMETAAHPPTEILSTELRREAERHDPFERYRNVEARLRSFSSVDRMLRADAAILLPDTFLEKVDRATMASGIETRVPFLDTKLSTYAMGLPSAMKVRRGQTKWILKKALRPVLPATVLNGRKAGFGVPYSHWLRTSLSGYMHDVLTDPVVAEKRFFEPTVLQRLMREHQSGTKDHGFLLWKALNLALWCSRYGA